MRKIGWIGAGIMGQPMVIHLLNKGYEVHVYARHPERVEQAKNAGITEGLLLASDAYFPFDDVVRLAHQYGVSAIIQPGGSVRDELSIQACNELGIAMIFTGVRHFRH